MSAARARDLIVIGAGPAGMGAAVEASAVGASVLLLDEAPAGGGQVYRPVPSSYRIWDTAALGPDYATGERLRQQLKASNASCVFNARVWSVSQGFRVDAVTREGARTWSSKRLLVATGAYERMIPTPGWTRPGVVGLAAATVLLKSQQILPGRATLVAGAGPLLYAVGAAIAKADGRVIAVVDSSARSDWLRAFPSMAASPTMLARGLTWPALLKSKGIPILFRHCVTEIKGNDEGVSAVRVSALNEHGKVDQRKRTRNFEIDSIAMGNGLVPSTEITRLLSARHEFVPERGGWVPVADACGRTSIEGLYVAGDGGGIAGADAALWSGRLAGLAAAVDCGLATEERCRVRVKNIEKSLARARAFGGAMARMMMPSAPMFDVATPDTVICRCEDVTRADIESELARGAWDAQQLKSWTRCGMGPCQGRMCGQAVAALVARNGRTQTPVEMWTARVPIRPVSVESLTGGYRYDEIQGAEARRALVNDEGEWISSERPPKHSTN